MSTETTYHECKACGNLVKRLHGHRHGDGQQDSDEHPVYLLVALEDFDESLRPGSVTTIADCGCVGSA